MKYYVFKNYYPRNGSDWVSTLATTKVGGDEIASFDTFEDAEEFLFETIWRGERTYKPRGFESEGSFGVRDSDDPEVGLLLYRAKNRPFVQADLQRDIEMIADAEVDA